MELFVSLPENSLEMARAAWESGADAIKVHMNVVHEASGTRFGSFAEEAETVQRIIDAAPCPVGLMPGAGLEQLPTDAEVRSLKGLQFVDIYAEHMPLWFLDLPQRLIVAISNFEGFTEPPFFLTHIYYPREAHKNRIDMAEASIFGADEIGKPFTYYDYRRLRILQEYVDAPLVVPTQKRITPEDAVWLKLGGTAALMIGAVVTGRTPDSIAKATAAYRAAIDS